MLTRSRRTAGLLAAAVVGLTLLVTAGAATPASSTTGADLIIPMKATLLNGQIHLSASPRVDRETTILFIVDNKDRKARWFQVGLKGIDKRRTPLLKPGGSSRFYYEFRKRGLVPFRSSGPTAKPHAGVFRVV